GRGEGRPAPPGYGRAVGGVARRVVVAGGHRELALAVVVAAGESAGAAARVALELMAGAGDPDADEPVALHGVLVDLDRARVAVAGSGHADAVAAVALAPVADRVARDHVGRRAGARRHGDAVPGVRVHLVPLDGVAVAADPDAVAGVALAPIADGVLRHLVAVAGDGDARPVGEH